MAFSSGVNLSTTINCRVEPSIIPKSILTATMMRGGRSFSQLSDDLFAGVLTGVSRNAFTTLPNAPRPIIAPSVSLSNDISHASLGGAMIGLQPLREQIVIALNWTIAYWLDLPIQWL